MRKCALVLCGWSLLLLGGSVMADDLSVAEKGHSAQLATLVSLETPVLESEKGQSGPVVEGINLNSGPVANPEKTVRERLNDGRSLDEGCLPAESLTVALNAAHTHVVLNWYAPQSGQYGVYYNDNPNHGPYPGAGWTFLMSLNAVSPTHQFTTDLQPLQLYRNYVVVHECGIPANDDCADAILVGNGSHYYSNIAATTDGPETIACWGEVPVMQNDIWFRYTATCELFSVSLCNVFEPNFDNLIAIYDGWDCPTISDDIACSDDDCGPLQAGVTVPAVVGNQYLIRIAGYFGDYGTGYMVISPGAFNDDCASARTINDGFSYNFSNICASTDGPVETFSNGARPITDDLWYVWQADACGPCTLRTCGSNFDTQIAVYHPSDCPTSDNTAIAVNDDACNLQSRLVFNAESGESYLIRIGGYFGATGTGQFIIVPSTPANDFCTNPISAPPGSEIPFTTISACTDGPTNDPSCRPQHDIWFETSVGLCSYLEVSVCNSNFDTWIAVYEGNDCGNLSAPVVCNDDSDCPLTLTSRLIFYPTSSGPYLIRVGGYNDAVGSGTLTVSQIFVSYFNEACTGASTGNYGTFDMRNNCAGTHGDATTCGQVYNDLWYTLSAQTNATTTVTMSSMEFAPRVAVYHASFAPPCDNLSLVDCGDGEASFTVGQFSLGTYLIRVGGADVFEEGQFNLSITHD